MAAVLLCPHGMILGNFAKSDAELESVLEQIPATGITPILILPYHFNALTQDTWFAR